MGRLAGLWRWEPELGSRWAKSAHWFGGMVDGTCGSDTAKSNIILVGFACYLDL